MDRKTLQQNQLVTFPRTEQRIMYSGIENREYRIYISTPDVEPPLTGYPVIYLLDANAVFGTMVEAIRAQSSRPEKSGVVPAIIVGIGYSTDALFPPARHYDFTLPTPLEELPARPGGEPWPKQGGAESFLSFIQEELKPVIEREYQIDRSRQTIFGHSLGGFFVLHTLFTNPDAFQTYIAGSPSIHWNKRYLLEVERQFTSQLDQHNTPIGLLLAAGELERTHKCRMNDNAKELAERLSLIPSHKLCVEYKEFENEGHVSVLPVLISRALRFALAPIPQE